MRVDERLLHRIRSRNPVTDIYCWYYWSIIIHDDTPIIPAHRKQSGRAYYQLQIYIWSINHDLRIDSEKGNWVSWEGRSSDGSGRRSEPRTGFHSLCFYVNFKREREDELWRYLRVLVMKYAQFPGGISTLEEKREVLMFLIVFNQEKMSRASDGEWLTEKKN